MLRIENELVYCSDPKEYNREEFGKVVAFESIMQNPIGYLDVFSEGSQALKNLLKYSWMRGIETLGCCAGHEGVHTYVKDIFWKGRKIISKDEYDLNADSARYHDIVRDSHAPYFAFNPGTFGDKKDLAGKLEKSIQKLCPDLELFVDYGRTLNIVTVGTLNYVPESVREKFFNDVREVLSRELILQKSTSKDKKPSLSRQIDSASQKVASQSAQTVSKNYEFEHV